MPRHYALDARCAFALYRISNYTDTREQANYEVFAYRCGQETCPDLEIPHLIKHEEALLVEYMKGFAARWEELRPRTEGELRDQIAALSKQALAGCGQFYELFEQRFTSAAQHWLKYLPEVNKPTAEKMLLADGVYSPDEKGYWGYDPDENDVTYHGPDDVDAEPEEDPVLVD